MPDKILLVDDDADFLLVIARLLEGAGYEVSTAASVADARNKLGAGRPDVIVLDVLMPGEDGLAFAKQLSEDEGLKDIPVVLLTALADNTGTIMEAFKEDRTETAVEILPKFAAGENLVEALSGLLAAKG